MPATRGGLKHSIKKNLHLFKKIFLYSDFINGSFSLALQSVTHDRASQRMNVPLNDRAEARSPSAVQCCVMETRTLHA